MWIRPYFFYLYQYLEHSIQSPIPKTLFSHPDKTIQSKVVLDSKFPLYVPGSTVHVLWTDNEEQHTSYHVFAEISIIIVYRTLL